MRVTRQHVLRLIRSLQGALLACGVLPLLALTSSCVVMEFGSPSWLELPWSDFSDFLEGPEGRLYVDVHFYWRVLCYDREGRFIASYPAPFGGGNDRALAVDEHGTIYYRVRNFVSAYDRDWNLKYSVSAEDQADRTWALGEDGKPFYAPGRRAPAPDRAVRPRETLFSERKNPRDHFQCANGDALLRSGDQVVRHSSSRETVGRYGTPWLVSWALVPFPALLPLLGIPIALALDKVAARLRRPDNK